MAADDLAVAYALEEQRVRTALLDCGVTVNRLPELLDLKLPRACGPVLVGLLSHLDTQAAREFVIRAMIDRSFAGVITNDLVALFQDDEFALHRWIIGQALAVVATPADAEAIVRIAGDRRLGRGRQMIVAALGRVKSRDADLLLLELLDDPDVDGHAVRGLASLPVTRLRELDVSGVRPFEKDGRAWVRRSAAAVLKKATASGG